MIGGTYAWVNDDGYENLGDWVYAAYERAKKTKKIRFRGENMAKIKSGNFIMDVRLDNYCDEIIDYHIRFIYKGSPLFNPTVLVKDCLLVQSKGQSLISFLEETLQLDKEGSWNPTETDDISVEITCALSPGLKNIKDPDMSKKSKERFRKVDELRKSGGKCREDMFTLDLSFFLGSLGNPVKVSNQFSFNRVSFGFILQRHELQKFYLDLRKEYGEFCKRFKIDNFLGEVKEMLDENIQKKQPSKLENKFEKAMRNIHELARQKYGHKGDTLIGMTGEHGGVEAAKKILRGPEKASGLIRLKLKEMSDGNGLDLSVEKLIIDPKWASLFTKLEVKKAKERLRLGNN